jgi:hypothetical protein
MKKHLAAAATVFVMVLTMSASMFAQYSGRMTVNVPFSFVVENNHFQAGDYVFEKVAHGRLRIYTTDGRISANFLAIPTEGKLTAEAARFTFHRYGHEYFLAKIATPGLNTGWEVMQGKAEQELASRKTPVELAVILGH